MEFDFSDGFSVSIDEISVVGLVNYEILSHLWKVKKKDLFMLIITFVGTLTLGVELGLLIAVCFSLVVVIQRISFPHMAVVGRLPGKFQLQQFKQKELISEVSHSLFV